MRWANLNQEAINRFCIAASDMVMCFSTDGRQCKTRKPVSEEGKEKVVDTAEPPFDNESHEISPDEEKSRPVCDKEPSGALIGITMTLDCHLNGDNDFEYLRDAGKHFHTILYSLLRRVNRILAAAPEYNSAYISSSTVKHPAPVDVVSVINELCSNKRYTTIQDVRYKLLLFQLHKQHEKFKEYKAEEDTLRRQLAAHIAKGGPVLDLVLGKRKRETSDSESDGMIETSDAKPEHIICSTAGIKTKNLEEYAQDSQLVATWIKVFGPGGVLIGLPR